jgi:hypothetical protein
MPVSMPRLMATSSLANAITSEVAERQSNLPESRVGQVSIRNSRCQAQMLRYFASWYSPARSQPDEEQL